MIATTRQFTPALLDSTVRVSNALTLADRVGEVPEWVLVIAGTCAAAYAVISRRAQNRKPWQALRGREDSSGKQEA
jgi:apolipoprotein N-acyltransferase